MKEQFYIDMRIREEALKRFKENPIKERLDKSATCCDMCFPNRECRPIVRRRTMAEVWKLIEK